MADRVRYNMDRMAGVFRQMEEAELFSKEEVKAIVKKRTDYEYLMMRFELKVEDVSGYLDYEHVLDKVLTMRIKKQNMTYQDKSRQTLQRNIANETIKHINYIYTRALRRFPTSMPLYLRCIEYLQQKEATNLLDMLLGKAIALQPKEERFYILAAQHEVRSHSNIFAARVLLQRGLRTCNQSPDLWRTYLDLEAWTLLRAMERFRLLNLPVATTKPTATAAATSDGPEEKDLDGIIGNKLSVYNTQPKKEETLDLDSLQAPLLVVAKYAAKNMLSQSGEVSAAQVRRVLAMARSLLLVAPSAAALIEKQVEVALAEGQAGAGETEEARRVWSLHQLRVQVYSVLAKEREAGLLASAAAMTEVLQGLQTRVETLPAWECAHALRWMRTVMHKVVDSKVKATIAQAEEVEEVAAEESKDVEEVVLAGRDDAGDADEEDTDMGPAADMAEVELNTIREHLTFPAEQTRQLLAVLQEVATALVPTQAVEADPVAALVEQTLGACAKESQRVAEEAALLKEVRAFVRMLPTVAATAAKGRGKKAASAVGAGLGDELLDAHAPRVASAVAAALGLCDKVLKGVEASNSSALQLVRALPDVQVYLCAVVRLLRAADVSTVSLEALKSATPWLLAHARGCKLVTAGEDMTQAVLRDAVVVQRCVQLAHLLLTPSAHLAAALTSHLLALRGDAVAFRAAASMVLVQLKRDYVHALSGVSWQPLYLLALRGWGEKSEEWAALLQRACRDCEGDEQLQQMLVEHYRDAGEHDKANHLHYAKRRRL